MSNVSKGQIQLPGEFRPGEPIRAGEMDKLRKAIAFVMKDMIGSGRGITVTQSAGKYLISARKQRRGGAAAPTHPFQIVQATNEAGDQNLIKFHLGRVNGQIPTIGDPPLPITSDVDDDDNPTIQLPGTETHFISLKVTLNASFQPDTIEIQAETAEPTDTTTEAYYTLATVVTDSDVITTINQGWLTNATYFYAGDDNHIFFI